MFHTLLGLIIDYDKYILTPDTTYIFTFVNGVKQDGVVLPHGLTFQMPLHFLQFVVISNLIPAPVPLGVGLDPDPVLFNVTFDRPHAQGVERTRPALEGRIHGRVRPQVPIAATRREP